MVKKNQKRIPASLLPWIDARRRFHLSHERVQMARELGMNPKKLGKLDNHHQEPWKLPLPQLTRPARGMQHQLFSMIFKRRASSAPAGHDHPGVRPPSDSPEGQQFIVAVERECRSD
jgi:hypothetical protein